MSWISGRPGAGGIDLVEQSAPVRQQQDDDGNVPGRAPAGGGARLGAR